MTMRSRHDTKDPFTELIKSTVGLSRSYSLADVKMCLAQLVRDLQELNNETEKN